MEIETQTCANTLCLTIVADRIDAAGVIHFKDRVLAEIEAATSPRVILDLNQVGFVDSSGLGGIVSIMKHLGTDKRLDLCALTPTVTKVFRLTRMDSVFHIYASLDIALQDADAA